MDCETCQEAVSARLDGEAEPVPAEWTDRHLQDCARCQAWQARAADYSRDIRVREVAAVPDLTAAILDASAPATRRPRPWPRLALGGIAVAQLTLGMAQLLGADTATHGGHPGGQVTGHLFNESTAWNLALGLGLLWTALRPKAASGMLPVTAGFVVVLAAFSAHDLVTGAATVSRVAGHGLVAAGLALLAVVHRQHRERPGPRPGVRSDPEAADSPEPARADPAIAKGPGQPDHRRGRPGLRPAGHRRAA